MSEVQDPKQLTTNDPVDAETLAKFEELDRARTTLALNLLSLEQRKVQILASVKRVDEQFYRLVETVLVDRGLPPDAEVDIDPKTGKLTLAE